MPNLLFPLDAVEIATPCPARWDSMSGTDRIRFCPQCRLNVYNLSGLSRGEAEALVAAKEGRLCIRFFRRIDGTILTQVCPVGIRLSRRRPG